MTPIRCVVMVKQFLWIASGSFANVPWAASSCSQGPAAGRIPFHTHGFSCDQAAHAAHVPHELCMSSLLLSLPVHHRHLAPNLVNCRPCLPAPGTGCRAHSSTLTVLRCSARLATKTLLLLSPPMVCHPAALTVWSHSFVGASHHRRHRSSAHSHSCPSSVARCTIQRYLSPLYVPPPCNQDCICLGSARNIWSSMQCLANTRSEVGLGVSNGATRFSCTVHIASARGWKHCGL